MPHSEFLATALEAARAADDVVRHYYQRNLQASRSRPTSRPSPRPTSRPKRRSARSSPRRFPAHGFHGEETGTSALDAEYVWFVDPIDGTKAFVREYPMFSTQIALMRIAAA